MSSVSLAEQFACLKSTAMPWALLCTSVLETMSPLTMHVRYLLGGSAKAYNLLETF